MNPAHCQMRRVRVSSEDIRHTDVQTNGGEGMRQRVMYALLLGSLTICPAAWATTYTVDSTHTTVEFKIRHLLVYVRGQFNEVEGTFDYDPEQPETWKVTATVPTAGIDTRVADRDTHLRSPDFFDAATFPTLSFVSTQVTDVTPTGAKLHGLLTIHGVERPVVFDLVIHGVVTDPWGKVRSAFTATTTINRKDFGLTWNKVLETGQLLVGEEVEIILEIEGIARE